MRAILLGISLLLCAGQSLAETCRSNYDCGYDEHCVGAVYVREGRCSTLPMPGSQFGKGYDFNRSLQPHQGKQCYTDTECWYRDSCIENECIRY